MCGPSMFTKQDANMDGYKWRCYFIDKCAPKSNQSAIVFLQIKEQLCDVTIILGKCQANQPNTTSLF